MKDHRAAVGRLLPFLFVSFEIGEAVGEEFGITRERRLSCVLRSHASMNLRQL